MKTKGARGIFFNPKQKINIRLQMKKLLEEPFLGSTPLLRMLRKCLIGQLIRFFIFLPWNPVKGNGIIFFF